MKKCLFFIPLLLAVSACQASLSSQPTGSQPVIQTQPSHSTESIDIARGQFTSPAAFGVSVQFLEPGFQTQASSSGGLAKSAADLTDFNLYLLECVTASVPTAGSAGSPVDLEADPNCAVVYQNKRAKAGGFAGSQSFLFENLPVNSAANKSYFVAIAGEQSSLNISKPTGYIIGGATPSNGPVALSATGGNGSGGVHVDSNYSIASQTGSLGVALNLLSEHGAKIDSTVTVTGGTTGYSGSISVSTP